MPPEITVSGPDGAFVLRYWKLAEGSYFGGTVGDWARELMPFAYGPHVWHTTNSLLGVVADIARLDAEVPYLLQGSGSSFYDQTPVGRQMQADKIARIVGCTEDEVRSFYRLVIEVPDAS